MLHSIKKLIGDKGRQLIVPIVLMSLDAIGSLVMYLMLYFTVVHLLSGTLSGTLVRNYTIVCLISVILRLIIYRSGYFLCFSRGAKMCSNLRLQLANHYRSLSLGYFNQNSSGYLLTTLTKDLSNFELVLTHTLPSIIKTLVMGVLILTGTFFINWKLALAECVVILIALPILHQGNVLVEKYGKMKRDLTSKMVSIVLEYIKGMKVFKSANMTSTHFARIESTAVSLTAALLCELTKKKIKVIFCDEKRNPSSELIGYYGAHDTSLKVRNQIAWSEEIKKHVWTEIVAEKIRKQALHLNYWNRGEAEQLYEYINEIEFGDATNREGHAAKVYFNALFGMDFTRSAENVTNAALNYGYSLLLSTFNRCVVANGYITQLGLFHDNVFNQFNLACDLMEPFRPIVDMKVKKMGFSFFEKEQKYEMISLLKEEVIIGNRNEYLTNAIKIYTKSVFDALNDNDVSQIKFYRTNEL